MRKRAVKTPSSGLILNRSGQGSQEKTELASLRTGSWRGYRDYLHPLIVSRSSHQGHRSTSLLGAVGHREGPLRFWAPWARAGARRVQKLESSVSRGIPVVVAKQSAKPLVAVYPPFFRSGFRHLHGRLARGPQVHSGPRLPSSVQLRQSVVFQSPRTCPCRLVQPAGDTTISLITFIDRVCSSENGEHDENSAPEQDPQRTANQRILL